MIKVNSEKELTKALSDQSVLVIHLEGTIEIEADAEKECLFEINRQHLTVIGRNGLIKVKLNGRSSHDFSVFKLTNEAKDITFENIQIEGVKMGLTAYGIESSPMELTLRNVEYTYAEGAEDTPMFRVAHCSAINLENVKINGFAGASLIRAWSDGVKINTENLDCDLSNGELLVRADEEFVCRRL